MKYIKLRTHRCLCLLLFAATFCYPLFGQQDCAYEAYYKMINEAEYQTYKKHLDTARVQYQAIFSGKNFPLALDLIKALEVARQLNDSIWMESLSVTLAKGGIPLSYFKPFDHYSWYPKFEARFPVYQEYFSSNFDLALRQRIIDIGKQDSIVNANFHKWRKGLLNMSLNELITGAKSISDAFKAVYDQHGLPSENKIGYFISEDQGGQSPVWVLLIHIYQRGESILNPEMERIKCDGKLRPELADNLYGMKGFGKAGGSVEEEMKVKYVIFGKKKWWGFF